MSHPPGGQQGLKDTKRRYVVLDRDGTIIVDRHYLSDPSQVELLPGAAEGLRQMQALGLGLIVITNQSGIGRGLFDWGQLDRIHERLHELLAAEGVHLNGIYVCPHKPDDNCQCRKPAHGLLKAAAQDLRFDPQDCFVIGDKSSDIELGRRVGAITFLMGTGYGTQMPDATVSFDYIIDDLKQAARLIQRRIVAAYRSSTFCRWFEPSQPRDGPPFTMFHFRD